MTTTDQNAPARGLGEYGSGTAPNPRGPDDYMTFWGAPTLHGFDPLHPDRPWCWGQRRRLPRGPLQFITRQPAQAEGHRCKRCFP